MQTLEQFLAGSRVSMRCREYRLEGNPLTVVSGSRGANHYLCELHGSNGDRPVRLIVGFEDGPPELVDVLDVLAAEAAVAEEAEGFEAWARQMGYEASERRGKRQYRTKLEQAELLRRLLGEEGYRRLLWETERL